MEHRLIKDTHFTVGYLVKTHEVKSAEEAVQTALDNAKADGLEVVQLDQIDSAVPVADGVQRWKITLHVKRAKTTEALKFGEFKADWR